MRMILTLVAVAGVITMSGSAPWPSHAAAAQRCQQGCNLVEEGLVNQNLVNRYVYERTSRGFTRVLVLAVDPNTPWGGAIRWYHAESGKSGWNDARSYYSEASYRAIVASGQRSGGYEAPIDRESRQRLAGVCGAYGALRAKSNKGWAEMLMMEAQRRACCDSSDAQRFGRAPICSR